MKKVILSFVLVLGSLSLVNAQQNAIGLKLGTGAELSYQRDLSDANRLEFNLGLHGLDFDNPYLGLSGFYQWVWDLSGLAPGFKWYAGAGAGLGLQNSKFALAVLGNIGIEYNFGIPLQIALDYTPGLQIVPDTGFDGDRFRFAIRYKF